MSVNPEEFKKYLGSSEGAQLTIFKLLCGAVPTGIWYTDEQGALLYVSESWSNMMGIPLAEAAGHKYQMLLHPADTEATAEAIKKAISTRGLLDIRFRLRNSEDTYKWYHSIGTWIEKHNGFPAGLVGLTFDVTHSNNEVTENAMLWQCLDQVHHPIVITDATLPDNPIRYVNPAFTRLSGYTADDVVGKNPRLLHNTDRDQPALQQVREAIQQGRPLSNAVIRNYTKSGTQYTVELHLSPVYAASVLTYWVGMQVVVTDRVKAQEIEELMSVVNKLREMSRGNPSIGAPRV